MSLNVDMHESLTGDMSLSVPQCFGTMYALDNINFSYHYNLNIYFHYSDTK